MGASRIAAVVSVPALVAWALPLAAWAHQPDTSYLKLRIGEDAVESRFTFDSVTLLRIAPGLDADGDNAVTRAEVETVRPVIEKYLRQRVFLDLDDDEADWGEAQALGWPNQNGEPIFRSDWHQLLIHFPFRRSVESRPRDVVVTYDVFIELGTRHKVLAEFTTGDVRHPVVFSLAEPDYLFDVNFALAQVQGDSVPGSGVQENSWLRFFRLGMEHIFVGYDHILFLLALIVVSRLRQVIAIVTAFTAGHTVTLILATLEVMTLPSRWVESAIAATIVYVAAENLRRGQAAGHRWLLTGAFGLVHGFGFAGMLRELGLPRDGLMGCLLTFNLGVEAGQVLIVLAMSPFLWLLGKWRHAGTARAAVSWVILICGAGWLVDRVFGLAWMPF